VLGTLTDRELASLRLLRDGTPLRRYRRYLELHDPGRAEFAADGSEVVEPAQRLVARDGAAPEAWAALCPACGFVVGRRTVG